MRLRFLTINIFGHTGLATSILRLRLIMQIQKLKSQSEIIEIKIIRIQIEFVIKQIFFLC